jgi:alpha-glucosidase (family GH31 glycosyl hydrolase)
VSWDEHDGIKSAVTGLLSSGLSGYSLERSDIGGYTAIDNPLLQYHRSKELLMRWIELAAFTVVFRTTRETGPRRTTRSTPMRRPSGTFPASPRSTRLGSLTGWSW